MIFSGAFWTLAAVAAAAGARRRLPALGVAFGLWLLAVFGVKAVAGLAMIFLACLAAGDVLFGSRWRVRFGLATAGLLALCIGLVLLMFAVGLSASWPIHTQAVYAAGLAAVIVLGRRRLRIYADGFADWARTGARMGLGEFLACAMLLYALAAQSVYASLPEQYHDALGVHLMVAASLAGKGVWIPDPANFVSAVSPMGANWVFAAAHVLGGEPAAKFANFSLLMLLCGLLANAVAWRHGRAVGVLGAALLASTPLAFIETASLFAENALAVFFLSATVLLARSYADTGKTDAVALGLLLAGGALVKLHFVFFALPFGIALGAVLLRYNPLRRALPVFALAAVVGVVVACQPYLQAYMMTGNPVFPWFNAVFQSPFFDSSANFSDNRWSGNFSLLLPYQWVFETGRFIEGADGALGFALAGLLLSGVLAAAFDRNRMALAAVALAAGYAVLLAPVTQYARYFYPVLPLALVVCAEGLRAFSVRQAGLSVSALGLGALFLALGMVSIPTAGWMLASFDVDVSVDERRKGSFVETRVPYRALVRAVNALEGDRARVLILGQPVGVGLAGTPIYGNWYNPKVSFELWNAKTPGAVAAVMGRNGITHAFWRPGAVPENDPLQHFLYANGVPLMTSADAVLYAIPPQIADSYNLLWNSDFALGLEKWDIVGVDPATEKGPVTLVAGSFVAQSAGLSDPGHLGYKAGFTCEAAKSVIRHQVNWLDEKGQLVDIFIREEHCAGAGVREASFTLSPPKEARIAFVYFQVIDGPAVLLQNLSLVQLPP